MASFCMINYRPISPNDLTVIDVGLKLLGLGYEDPFTEH